VTRAAPGRPRSLGASLLDQVLAETVDPAYAQAAAARAARAAVSAPEPAEPGSPPPGRPSWIRRRRGQGLVALTLALAGLLASVTYEEAASGAQGRQEVRDALRSDIREETDRVDDLSAQLEQLTAEVNRARDEALAASAIGQRALEQLATAEQQAAVVPVSGPGLEVTLGNAPAAADSDPIGGSEEVAQAGVVQDSDVQQVVNALWSSGAEAVSINGQRLGPTTAVRQAGGAILVDFQPVSSPYEIRAIGDPDTLTNRFLSTPEASFVADLTRLYGVVFDFARADELQLPGATSPELRTARPLDPAADPPAADTPDSTTDGG
jgi:uncharacterized protein YlxW (UPF0749 family)